MSWTYTAVATPLDEVRFLIGDTDQAKPWTLQNEEINYALALYSALPPVIGQNFLAAANCAEGILVKLKGTVADKKVGDLSITYNSNMLAEFGTRAYQLRQKANLQGVGVFVGGSSVSDKRSRDEDPDRVQPASKVDGMNKTSQQNRDNPSGF